MGLARYPSGNSEIFQDDCFGPRQPLECQSGGEEYGPVISYGELLSGLSGTSLHNKKTSALFHIQPWVGHSWEGFVIEQILSCLDSLGRNRQPYFFKTSDGYEIDLVLILNGEIWAFEIKLSGSSGRKEMDKLKRTSEMIGADKMVLISRTRKEILGKHIISLNIFNRL